MGFQPTSSIPDMGRKPVPRYTLSPVSRCRRVFRGLSTRYERRVEVGGLSGWYTDIGAGEPVVVLASTLVMARSYEWTVDCLAPHFRVITVEMPGSGRASRPPVAWDFADYAKWVAGFVDAVGLDRPTVVGHSNSGGTALALAADHPRAVGRLVLVGAVGADPSPSMLRVLLGRSVDAVLEPRLTVFGWHHVIYNSLAFTRDFFGQVWKSVYADLTPYALRVRAPTLLAWGARDHTIPPRCADVLRELIPNSIKYVSREGSHDWLIDRAPEFAAALGRFVSTKPAARW
jgi:pimeloyl-ACP methyl ester carboxylesterase